MHSNVIDIQQLRKAYGTSTVFSAVHLQVRAAEQVAIAGESGVGKSSLLNCIAGLEPWDQGSVTVCDADLGALSADARAHLRRDHIGFVFQAFHVLPHLDVLHNVALPLMLQGRQDWPRVRAMLESLGIGALGERLPHALSGGQLQRVAIARALVHRPRLLLADEPTGNLDPVTAQQVMQTLTAQCREHGTALVLVTHSSNAAAMADRILQLTPNGLYPLAQTDTLRR